MRAVWMSAAWQALTTLVADGVSLAVDWKYHGIDYFSCWVRDMRRFLAYMLVVATLGGTLCAPPTALCLLCSNTQTSRH